ncbi:hypothetical protein INT43_003012 [Umbelopsis isabellina]|uniref:Kinesin-like protein n=1 Tax=Mortierella isabellina TaxID=91625 RepID=A0A8H7PQ52_MORIS|nr:hypothetical protein INT43_003012 [Umbelopsis isabellina]
MATALLDTLKKADLDQYYSSFSSNGISHLESLAQISMQDYSRLGVTTMKDRRKLFQLVQGLRQELPSYENGLLASNQPASPSTYRRPSEVYQRKPEINSPTRAHQGPITPSPPLPLVTRSRSRTLPGHLSRPDIQLRQLDTYSEDQSDEEDLVPIRRGSGPSNPYGMPQASRVRHSPRPASTSSALAGASIGVTTLANTKAGQSDLNQKIRVCVRKRPLSRKEVERAEKDIAPTVGIRSININEPKMKVDLTKYVEQHSFTFDEVFDVDADNQELYQRTALPLVKYVFGGGKATCFAYGQTGSGKTFTMLDQKHGLYVLAARDIFAMLKQPQYQHLSAWIGFYEIYQGQLYDLLNDRKKLFAREDGKQNVVIAGLKEFPIDNVDNLMQVFEFGSQARSTGSTGANADSSRSHAILQVLLKPRKNRKKIAGKLSFIDLAGSERGADRGDADTKTRMEGAEINKSLLALKECIRALDQDKRHTPFRQSKLTQVLKDSFVGNSRTCMIATISPNQSNSEHTLNTLRYADRVKELKGERERRPYSENLSDEHYMAAAGYQDGDNDMDDLSADDDEQFLNDDFVESDDPDLYKVDDDTFLDDEDFPQDTDINILDEEFLHEGNDRVMADPPAAVSPVAPSPTRQRSPSGIARYGGLPSGPASHAKTLSDGSKTGLKKTMQYERPRRDYDDAHKGLSLSPVSLQDNDAPTSPSSHSARYNHLSHMGRSYSSGGDSRKSSPQPKSNSQHVDSVESIIFDADTIDDFVSLHRAEVREVNDCTKRETKLLANFSLGLSSRRNLQEGETANIKDDIKTSSEFIDYLGNLDEVLDMKMAAIEALRDRIRVALGEDTY